MSGRKATLSGAGLLFCAAALVSPPAQAVQGGTRPAAPAAAGAAAPAKPRPPLLKATLANGLRLYCRANDASEIVSVVCLVRAGLPDEREQDAGLAALTAEALLKGTRTHSGEAFADAVAKAGGNIRTLPGFDFTEISIVTSRDQFEPALKLIADVVARPRFAPEDVEQCKQTLKRRMSSVNEDFTGGSYQTLCAQLYPRSPYGRPINGYEQTIDRLTTQDVQKFWERCYVQNRMVVTVVGDVSSQKALSLASTAFRTVPYKPGVVTTWPGMERLDRPKVEWIQRPGPAAQLMVGFRAPAAKRAEYPVYAVVDAVVGGGKRARLFQNIREKEEVGYELGSFYQPLLFQSHLVGYVVTPASRRDPRTEKEEFLIDKVKGLLLDQYRQLAATGPTEQELVRARSYVVGRYAVMRQERTRDQAKWLAWNVAMGLGEDFDQFFPTRAQSVTRQEVQDAAKRILAEYAMVVTVPEPPQ